MTPEQFESEVAPPISPPLPSLLKVGSPGGGVVALFTRKMGNTARTQGTSSDLRSATVDTGTSISQRKATALVSQEHRKLQLLVPRLRSSQRLTSTTGPILIQLSTDFIAAFVAPIGVTRQEVMMVVTAVRVTGDDAHAKDTVVTRGAATDKVTAAGPSRRMPSRCGARPCKMSEGDTEKNDELTTCASAHSASMPFPSCAPAAVAASGSLGAVEYWPTAVAAP